MLDFDTESKSRAFGHQFESSEREVESRRVKSEYSQSIHTTPSIALGVHSKLRHTFISMALPEDPLSLACFSN